MTGTVYEEQLFAGAFVAILGATTAALGALVAYQLAFENGLGSSLGVVSVALFVLFAALTVNFRRLSIRLTEAGVTVGYGVIRTTVPWERITACTADEASSLRYGGWGVRVTRIGGRWRLVFNTVGDDRVVLRTDGGRFREIAFSTARPEAVRATVARHIDRTE